MTVTERANVMADRQKAEKVIDILGTRELQIAAFSLHEAVIINDLLTDDQKSEIENMIIGWLNDLIEDCDELLEETIETGDCEDMEIW